MKDAETFVDGSVYHKDLAEKLRDIGGIFIKGTGMIEIYYKTNKRRKEITFPSPRSKQIYKDIISRQKEGAKMTNKWAVRAKSSKCRMQFYLKRDHPAYQKFIRNNKKSTIIAW